MEQVDRSRMLTKNVGIVDLGLKVEDTLVIADVHIGYEEALNKQGFMIPRFQFKDVMKRLDSILKKAKPGTIVINGDLKHEFGRISDQEWRETLRFLDLCARYAEVILVRGNHDTVLGPIADKRKVKVVDYHQISAPGEKILVLHGDAIPRKMPDCDTIIIGHEHPAVRLWEKQRYETYKCFLKGTFRKKTLIVQPSMFLSVEGTDVLSEKTLSPFLKQNLDDFEVFVPAEGAVYNFGSLKGLKQ